jgi:hypothetical protein
MFVGDVRCAIPCGGSSWKLSGGRSLSSAPTNVSKNRQVRRATVRRKAASPSVRRERFSRIGWLSHQDAPGARNHSAITGPATGSAPGLRRARPVATTAAVTGKIHIET